MSATDTIIDAIRRFIASLIGSLRQGVAAIRSRLSIGSADPIPLPPPEKPEMPVAVPSVGSCAGSSLRGVSNVLPEGTLLKGRYRIEALLGMGGFGITYRATDLKTNADVAVKELYPQHYVHRDPDNHTVRVNAGNEEEFRHMYGRFEDEAKILIDLQDQEGVVRLMHLFSENQTSYYVMELLIGEDLRKHLQKHYSMTWDQLAPVMKTVLRALEPIHARGLIHRDISPDNIYLTPTGARLIDFGNVRDYHSQKGMTAVVKHCFAPLEQYQTKGHQGPWTDVYSLCVTAYYCLSGKLPPRATERIFQDELIPLSSLCPNLPPKICKAIHKGMAVKAEDRFQNIRQLREALFPDSADLTVPASGKLSGKKAQTPTAQTAFSGLQCLKGAYGGKSWSIPVGAVVRIGREPGRDIKYPDNYQGVSRKQCTVWHHADGHYYVRDDQSSYGTFLYQDGKHIRLAAQQWYAADGLHICFGKEEYAVKK